MDPEDPLEALAADLRDLAERRIERVFQKVSGRGPLALDHLFRVAKNHSPGLWAGDESDRRTAITDTLKAAIGQIPVKSSRQAKINWPDAAAVLYGLCALDEPAHTQAKVAVGRDDEYQVWVHYLSLKAELEKASPSFRRLTGDVRAALARALLEMEDNTKSSHILQGDALVWKVDNRSTPTHSYIRRNSYHEQFVKLLASGARCVVLVGLPGIGKTWLAKAFMEAHLQDAKQIPLLRLRKGRLDPQDLHRAITGIGVSVKPQEIQEQPEMWLAELLCGKAAPDFVVFDNVDDFREIDSLLPHQIKSRLIVTCRAINQTTRDQSVIRVDRMIKDEAVQLVNDRLPTLAPNDAEMVARSLGGYPILIHLACDLLASWPNSVRQFCDSMKTEAAELAQTEYSDAGEQKTLLVILRRLLSLIEQESVPACELLTCVAFMDRTPEVDLSFALSYLEKRLGRKVTQTDLLRAFDVFRRYSVLDVVREEISFTHQTGNIERFEATWLQMHTQTQRLIQRLLLAKHNEVKHAASQVLHATLDEIRDVYRQNGLPPDLSDLNFALDIENEESQEAADHYERFGVANTHVLMAQVEADIVGIVEKVKQDRSLRMGVLNVVIFRRGLPVTVVDFDQDLRPAEGFEVELCGYRFNLLRAMTPRGYSLADAKSGVDNPPVRAAVSRNVTWEPDARKTAPMPCTSLLVLDEIFGFVPSPRRADQKPRVDVTPAVMYVGPGIE
jgi:hypothetical protein